jgi:glycosyltransferase involved in cell wall biosynthesis
MMLAGKTIVASRAGGIPDLVDDRSWARRKSNISDTSNANHCDSNNDGSPDAPDGGDAPVAWMVPPKDSQAIAEAILNAFASPEVCKTLQQRAKRRAESHFTADHMVAATLAAYRDLLAQKG